MDGIRQVLCVMTLLAYNLIVCYVLSHQEGDLEFCDDVLNKQLKVKNGRRFRFPRIRIRMREMFGLDFK